jgi:hypothetical protein
MRQSREFGRIIGNSDGLGTARKTTGSRETATDTASAPSPSPAPHATPPACAHAGKTPFPRSAPATTHPVVFYRIYRSAPALMTGPQVRKRQPAHIGI